MDPREQYRQDLKNAIEEYETTNTPILEIEEKYFISRGTIYSHTKYRRKKAGPKKRIDRKKVCTMYKRKEPFEKIIEECDITKNYIFKILQEENVARNRQI
jgi:hypothetical protein